jgi:hypothetical protein
MQFRELASVSFPVSESLVQKMDEWNQLVKLEFEKTNGAIKPIDLLKPIDSGKSAEGKPADLGTALKIRTTSLTHISSSKKDLNLIRLQINKLTPGDQFVEAATNCLAQIQQIVDYYRHLVNGADIWNEISGVIYTACVSSNLFSEMYADFFVLARDQLIDLHLYEYLIRRQMDYFSEFDAIVDVSPDDYDAFCRNTKQNDVRKYTSLFYTHLLKRGVFTNEQMLTMIRQLLTKIGAFHSISGDVGSNQMAQLESMVDNVSVLIMFSQSRLAKMDVWMDEVVPLLYEISPNCNDRIRFAWKRLLETVDA